MPAFNIHRLSHAALNVSNIERAREFYVDILGFVEVEKNGDELYLKGVEEGQHHSLILKKGEPTGLVYAGFRVSSPEDLDRARSYYESRGCRVTKYKEKAVDDALLVIDMFGVPMLFYYDMEYTGDLGLKFHVYKGAPPVRIHHVNLGLKTQDLEEGLRYYTEDLGFILAEYFLGPDGSKQIAWLTGRYIHSSHEVAIAKAGDAAFHHIAYYVFEFRDMVRIADILASLGMWDSIERGPGRHGATRGFHLYLRDPDGNRIELYQGDYVILDPDKWKPIEWRYEQARYRSDFWGRPTPERWREVKQVIPPRL
ncbi:MAG: 3,4-dihydroxyphenylacetate 2,3-dioxygenase [Sulfolobales archaeon]